MAQYKNKVTNQVYSEYAFQVMMENAYKKAQRVDGLKDDYDSWLSKQDKYVQIED